MQTIEWVSAWLLFNAISAIFQLYYGENKLIVNEMMIRSALYQTNRLSLIFIVLAHWNNSPRVDISIHSYTLFWFWANQSLLFLLNAVCLADKKKYQFYSLYFDPTGPRTHNLPYSRWPRKPKNYHYATNAVTNHSKCLIWCYYIYASDVTNIHSYCK